MEIKRIHSNKKRFLKLLLLADEQEDMIDRYLERGDMFALYDGGVKSICVVTEEAPGVYELKSLATEQGFQRRGYGRALVGFLLGHYAGRGRVMLVGTGDSPRTIPFYERCGFRYSHRVKDFFSKNYDHEIYEDGVKLVDMVYLKKDLRHGARETDSEL